MIEPAHVAAGGAPPPHVLDALRPLLERGAAHGALDFAYYDTHGNNVGTVSISGTVAHERTYSPWGEVVSSTGSPPQQGYCANLGHRQDAESALIYMRARYYESTAGRFVSQDPARDGINWYAYCANDPVSSVDATGEYKFHEKLIQFLEDSLGAFLKGLPGHKYALAIATIATGAIAIINELQDWADIASKTATGATAITELALIDGATSLAVVAASVAVLARYAKIGLKLAQAIVFATALVQMWLVLVQEVSDGP